MSKIDKESEIDKESGYDQTRKAFLYNISTPMTIQFSTGKSFTLLKVKTAEATFLCLQGTIPGVGKVFTPKECISMIEDHSKRGDTTGVLFSVEDALDTILSEQELGELAEILDKMSEGADFRTSKSVS